MTPVDQSNEATAVEVLADAFADDPVINWCTNYPSSIAPFFEITLQAFLPHKLTYLDPEERGAAAWLGPNEKVKYSYSLSNLAKMLKLAGATGSYRMALSGLTTEKHHPKTPHYYLFAIGATSANRGKGIGSQLISHILRRCDEEQMPAYLENSKEGNLGFYEGHGFKTIKIIRFAPNAPPLWLMWREPQPLEGQTTAH